MDLGVWVYWKGKIISLNTECQCLDFGHDYAKSCIMNGELCSRVEMRS